MIYDLDIKERLNRLYSDLGTWKKVAEEIGELSPAYWQQVAVGKREITLRGVNALRRADGLPPLADLVEVAPCPDCGMVHVIGRCHGKQGTPIILAPNELVRRKPAAKPLAAYKSLFDAPAKVLAAAIKNRQEYK